MTKLTEDERETLADQEIAALVFSAGHVTADGTGGRALRLHLMTCPTCSAMVKTADRILAARLAKVEALADKWATWHYTYPVSPSAYAAEVRAVLHPEDQP